MSRVVEAFAQSTAATQQTACGPFAASRNRRSASKQPILPVRKMLYLAHGNSHHQQVVAPRLVIANTHARIGELKDQLKLS
jgi:hypothetical protein